MSSIITHNYIKKLNGLINEFDYAPNLLSLFDFFIEQVQKDQTRIGNRNRKIFSTKDLKKINELKDSVELKRIIAYLNNIVKGFKGHYLHVHLNIDLSESLIDHLITLTAWDTLLQGLFDDDILNDQINSLKIRNARPIEALSNNGHSLNQIYRETYGLQHKLKFIEKIKDLNNNNQKSGILLNLNKSGDEHVYLSDFSKFPDSLNTFVNFGYGRKDIFKEMGREKVERLSTIVNLFPSITGKNIWYKDFLSDEINRYNNFKKVITITSGEKTPEALLEMRRQKKFLAEEIYTIFSFEL